MVMRNQRFDDERWDIAGQALAEARKNNHQHNIPILVEGKRDVETLRNLGFSGPIERIHRGQPLDAVIVALVEAYRIPRNELGFNLYLLMDWDRTGGRLQKLCRTNFESLDFRFDEQLRKTLMKYLFSITTTVEGMSGFLELILEKMELADMM